MSLPRMTGLSGSVSTPLARISSAKFGSAMRFARSACPVMTRASSA